MMNLPKHGRLAGIDFGTRRIGIAVTDPGQSIASPYENYTRRNERLDAERFRQLARDELLVGFVVGLPCHVSGEESQKSIEARAFGEWLSRTTELPVTFWDERYTSIDAEQQLQAANLTKKRRQARLDMLAAQIMLSAYLEAGRDGYTGNQEM